MCHGLVIHLFFTHTQRFVHRRRKVTAAGILGRQVILAARRYTPLAAVSDVALETLRSRRRVGALKNAAQRCRSTTVLVRATEGPIAVLQQTLSRRAALLEAARSHSAGTLTQLLGSATPADVCCTDHVRGGAAYHSGLFALTFLRRTASPCLLSGCAGAAAATNFTLFFHCSSARAQTSTRKIPMVTLRWH